MKHIIFHSMLVFLVGRCVQGNTYNIKAWQQLSNAEPTIPEVAAKIREVGFTGISFSGGGSRAYIAAIGYLSALHKLQLTDSIDYIAGISGYV